MRRTSVPVVVCLIICGCVGTTGSDLIEFNTYAAGPEGATPDQPLTFTTGRGWNVTLTRAKLHIGALYLDSAMPAAGSQATSCMLPGFYVASVPGPVSTDDAGNDDVDVLSGALQPFAVQGEGTATRALAGEIWLTGGDINATDDNTVILDVAGTATRSDDLRPFEGQITVGQNRAISASSPALPGANPICKQRIVSPIPVNVTPRAGGALLLRINPAGWFDNVDFSKLKPTADTAALYAFADDNSNQPSLNLFSGMKQASAKTYTFTWLNQSPQ